MSPSTHVSPIARRVRSARVRTGFALVALSLAGALVASPIGPAGAQEGDDGVPDDAQALDVEKFARYTHALGNSVPPTLTNQFPPQALCLVVPEFCTEDAEDLSRPINDVLAGDPSDPEDDGNQPEDLPAVTPPLAGPDDLPVSVIAGGRRHESAIKFPTPEVGEDELVDEFTVYLTQTDPSFTVDSPAFRQFIVGILSLARSDTSELPKTADRDLLDPEQFNGVEACVITTEFEEGDLDGNQAPRDDAESDTPGLDCGVGANGVLVAEDPNVWAFDLRLAANAWADGRLANEGILIRPITPPNLAYGDPDLSTSEQITFAGPDAEGQAVPLFSLVTAAKPEPVSFDGFDSSADVQGSQAETETFTEVLGGMEEPGTPVDRPAPEPEAAPVDQQAVPAVLSGDPVTAWWVWLLLPIFLAGAYLTTQGLTAEPARATERAGAMTRLIEARRAADAGS